MEIGQKVKVSHLRDRVSRKVSDRVGQSGVVQQYKLVDGSDVGVVVEFNDKFATWFFEDELTPV